MTTTKQTPSSEKVPTFNPTGAPEDQIYARGARLPEGRDQGYKPHSDFVGEDEAVTIYRLEQRERVASGIGLVASRVLLDNSIGDLGQRRLLNTHLRSHNSSRTSDPNKATPFVSFSSDPQNLAERLILRHGFGMKDGSDSVVVRAEVHPSRVLTPGAKPHHEVLLMGGVAPDEYRETHELADFVRGHVDGEEPVEVIKAGEMSRDEALQHWEAVRAAQAEPATHDIAA